MKHLLSILALCILAGCCTPPRDLGDRKVKDVFPYVTEQPPRVPSPYVIPAPPSQSSHGNTVTILAAPLDRLNEVGTHADFTVVATNTGAPITYQWYKWVGTNRTQIENATSNRFCIEGVQFSDVAGYEIVLSQANTEITNLMANLSVQVIVCGNSVQGMVQSPVTAFTYNPYSPIHCDGGLFPYSYSPWHLGAPVVFYGRYVPTTVQSEPGVNTVYPQLSIATYHQTSPPVVNPDPTDTACQLYNPAGTWAVNSSDPNNFNICRNTTPSTFLPDPQAARIPMYLNTSTNPNVASYRTVIYFDIPPLDGKIYWSWRYHY